jgi:hypothetical protein
MVLLKAVISYPFGVVVILHPIFHVFVNGLQ